MISKKQHGLMYSVQQPSKKPVVRWFIAFLVLIQFSLIWPIYPLVGYIEPIILGMPFSIVWVLLCILLSFSGLLAYFLWEEQGQKRQGQEQQRQQQQSHDVLSKVEQSKILTKDTTTNVSFSGGVKS